MPTPRTPVDTNDIVKRYELGESVKQISTALNVSDKVIRSRMKDLGLATRLRRLTGDEVEQIVARYQAGESQGDLAKAFDTPQATIWYWIDKRGAQISRSEAERRKWAKMTPQQRADQVSAAHEAVRGMVRTDEDLFARALTRERIQSHGTDEERMMVAWLSDRGIESVPQKAIGKYNIDVAAAPVAVELFGGGWHSHGLRGSRLPERTRYIADQGWNLLIIWTHKVHPLSVVVADEMVSYIQRSRSDPTFRRQYRVIWGDGKVIAAGSVDDDELTLIPTGIRGTYSRA